MNDEMKVSTTWTTVSYCITSGMINIVKWRVNPTTEKKAVLVDITPEEAEHVISELELAVLMANRRRIEDA